MSEYIISTLPANSVVLMQYDCYDTSVFATVKPQREDIVFYEIDSDREFSYHTWGHKFPEKTAQDIRKLADTKFADRDVYFLFSNYLEKYDPAVYLDEHFTEPYYFDGSIVEEDFALFHLER